jgi:nicotinate-nucleotide pyrophosphorylase (carboxylating)
MLTKLPPWQLNAIDKQLINLAFAEDLSVPFKDITTLTLFSGLKGLSKARIVSKHPESSILCGLPVLEAILSQFNKENEECRIHSHYQDGDLTPPGAELVSILAPAQVLLSCERILLNFLQRLCAVATITRKFVDRVSHTQAKILDTRKTTPGFRHLEKYAVHCGGGVNHRMGLYDAIMVKDTHVDLSWAACLRL